MMHKITITGTVLGTIGALSLFLERKHYGGISEDNILQESLFLPLGTFALLADICLIALALLQYLYKIITNKKQTITTSAKPNPQFTTLRNELFFQSRFKVSP